MKIATSQTATAPSSIPLWHFDELNGYWKQEDSANRQGDVYVGEVSHFSWWNCDIFLKVVNLTVRVTGQDGNPMEHLGVELVQAATSLVSNIQHTNELGMVSGIIPENETITVKVYDLCGNVLHESQVGPFNADATISIAVSELSVANVVGQLTTCAGNLVTEGYVVLKRQNFTLIAPVMQGNFNVTLPACENSLEFTIQGYDTANLQSTGVLSYAVSESINNVGAIPACNAIGEYVMMKIGNETLFIFDGIETGYDLQQSGNYPFKIRAGHLQFDLLGFYLENSSTQPGIYQYPSNSLFFAYRYFPNGNMEGYNATTPGGICTLTIHKYGAVGEFIDFSLISTHPDLETVQVTGHVIRDF